MGMKKGDSFITGPPFEILVAVVFAFLILGFIIIQSGGLKVLLDMICENVPELCYGVPERENVLIARDNWNVLGCTVNAMLTDKIPESDTECAAYVRGVEPPVGGGGSTAGIVGRMVSLPALGPLSLPVLGLDILGMQTAGGEEGLGIRAGEAMISCTEGTKEVKKTLTFAVPEDKALGCRCEANILFKIGGGTKFKEEVQGLSILEVADNCLTEVSEYVNNLKIEIVGNPDPSLHECSEVDLDTWLKDKISDYDSNIQSLEMKRCFCEQRLEGSFGKIGYPVYGLTEGDISAACYADYETLKQEAEKGKPFEPFIEPKVMSCSDDPESGDFYAWSTQKEVTVTEKELKCTVENFYLPEDFGGGIFKGMKEEMAAHIDGFGDPSFLVYVNYFPFGEASDWESLATSFKATGKLIMTGLCVVDVLGVFSQLKKFVRVSEVAKVVGKVGTRVKLLKTKLKNFFKNVVKIGGKSIPDEEVERLVESSIIVKANRNDIVKTVTEMYADKKVVEKLFHGNFNEFERAVTDIAKRPLSGPERTALKGAFNDIMSGTRLPDQVPGISRMLKTSGTGKQALGVVEGVSGDKLERISNAVGITLATVKTGTLTGVTSYIGHHVAKIESQTCKYDPERHPGNLVFKVPYDENCGEEFSLETKIIPAPPSPDPEKDSIVDIGVPVLLHKPNPSIVTDDYIPFYLASPCHADLTMENQEIHCGLYVYDNENHMSHCEMPKSKTLLDKILGKETKKCGSLGNLAKEADISDEIVEKEYEMIKNLDFKIMGDNTTINGEEYFTIIDHINGIELYLRPNETVIRESPAKIRGVRKVTRYLKYNAYYKEIGSTEEPKEFISKEKYGFFGMTVFLTKHDIKNEEIDLTEKITVGGEEEFTGIEKYDELDIMESGEDGKIAEMIIYLADIESEFDLIRFRWHIDNETGLPDRIYRMEYHKFRFKNYDYIISLEDNNEDLVVDGLSIYKHKQEHIELLEGRVWVDVIDEFVIFDDKDFDHDADSLISSNCMVDAVVVDVDMDPYEKDEKYEYCYKRKYDVGGAISTAGVVLAYGIHSAAKFKLWKKGGLTLYLVSTAIDCGIALAEWLWFKPNWPGE